MNVYIHLTKARNIRSINTHVANMEHNALQISSFFCFSGRVLRGYYFRSRKSWRFAGLEKGKVFARVEADFATRELTQDLW